MQSYSLSTNYRMRSPRHRRGMVLIVLLVCLAVAAALILSAGRIALVSHQATQTAQWKTQSRWLVESGMERAAAKLAADPAYAGETWNIPAAELGTEDNGVVRIEVKPVDGQPSRRAVRIEADFPDDPVHRTRQEKEIVIEIP
jgi:Tfp pilus assembly protein PilV